jgi:hypothetical protein
MSYHLKLRLAILNTSKLLRTSQAHLDAPIPRLEDFVRQNGLQLEQYAAGTAAWHIAVHMQVCYIHSRVPGSHASLRWTVIHVIDLYRSAAQSGLKKVCPEVTDERTP